MKDFITKDRVKFTLVLVLYIFIWQLISWSIGDKIYNPTPIGTLQALMILLSSTKTWVTILMTISRIVFSVIIAYILGGALGIIAGVRPLFELLLAPLVMIMRSVPTMSVILFAMIWIGNSWTPFIVGFLIVFPMVYGILIEGVKHIDAHLVEMGRIYKFSKKKMLRVIYLPSLFPQLKSAAINALGLGVKVVIAAEVLAGTARSVGWQLKTSISNINLEAALAWTIIALAIAVFLNYFTGKIREIQILERR